MDFHDHPDRPGWKVGPEVADTRRQPPASPVVGMRCLFGAAPGDWEHRLYLVPDDATIEDLVEFFEVGTEGALRHGWDERDTMDLVADKLSEINAIVPGTIERASSSALRFRFWRRLRLDELQGIEALFLARGVDEYQAGLALYIDGPSGDSLLAEARETGVLDLRWA